MRRLVIAAANGGFGGAANINEAFTLHSEQYKPALIVYDSAPYSFGEQAQGERVMITNSDERGYADELLSDTGAVLFIVDLAGLSVLSDYVSRKFRRRIPHPYVLAGGEHEDDLNFLLNALGGREIVFFWTGTQYLLNHERVNYWAERLETRVRFAMPDLLRCDPAARPLFQPCELAAYNRGKYKKFTALHSPGKKWDSKERLGEFWNEKGTEEINIAFEELKTEGIQTFILGGDHSVEHDISLMVKARSHVFVDKITNHSAGVGKSGLESIALGVPVLSSMHHTTETERYAGLPVIPIADAGEMKDIVRRFHGDERAYADECERLRAWLPRIGYAETVKYIEGAIAG